MLVALAVAGLSGCSTPVNAEACSSYEAAFNKVPDLVDDHQSGKATSKEIAVALEGQAASIKAAREAASSTVRAAIGDSAHYAEMAKDGTEDTFTAYHLQAQEVADACEADGSPIDLNLD